MARFTVKTNLEIAISELHKEAKPEINKIQKDLIISTEKKLGKFFNYAVRDYQKGYLSDRGVYLSPYLHRAHSHPVSKMLENHMLYQTLPGFTRQFKDIVAVSIKADKVNNLKEMGVDITDVINKGIEAKDRIRYGSVDATFIGNHDKAMHPKAISEEVGLNRNFFVHDEIHHWDQKQFIEFLEVNQPENMVFTVVYPVELLSGVRHSCNPGIYEFDIINGDLLFAPDGVFEEAYCQPVDLAWLFQASHFLTKTGYYTLTLVRSVAAHHMFVLCKGKYKTDSFRCFSSFTTLDMSGFGALGMKFVPKGVRYEIFMKILLYIESLRKTDSKNAVAKLRQLDPSNYNLEEYLFIKCFADALCKYGFEKQFEMSAWSQFWNGVFSKLPTFMQRLSSKFYAHQMLEMLLEVKRFKFVMKCDIISMDSKSLFKPLDSEFDFLSWVIFNDNAILDEDAPFYKIPTFGDLTGKDSSYVGIFRSDWVQGRTRMCNGKPIDEPSESHVAILLRENREAKERMFPWCKVPLCLGWREEPMKNKALELNDKDLDDLHLARRIIAEWNSSSEGEKKERIEKGKTEAAEIHSDSDSNLFSSEDESGSEIFCKTFASVPKPIDKPYSAALMANDIGHPEKLIPNRIVKGYKNLNIFKVPETRCAEVLDRLDFSRGKILNGRRAIFFCDSLSEKFSYGHNRTIYKGIWMPSAIRDLGRNYGHFNSCLAQKYSNKAKIGAHSDDESVYFDDDILTVNLCGRALFEITTKDGEFCEEIYLESGEAFIMPAGFQGKYKHSVMSLEEGRISLTYRLQRKTLAGNPIDLRPVSRPSSNVGLNKKKVKVVRTNQATFHPVESSLPDLDEVLEEEQKSKSSSGLSSPVGGICLGSRFDVLQEEVKPEDSISQIGSVDFKNDCFLEALACALNRRKDKLLEDVVRLVPDVTPYIMADEGLSKRDCISILRALEVKLKVINNGEVEYWGSNKPKVASKEVFLNDNHFTCGLIMAVIPSAKRNDKMTAWDIGNSSALMHRVDFMISQERKKALVESLVQSTTGVRSSHFDGGEKKLCKYLETNLLCGSKTNAFWCVNKEPIKLDVIYGFAGCGKSKPVQDDLKDFKGSGLVVSPRKKLLSDWKAKIGSKNKNLRFKTFETAFDLDFKNLELLVLDEIGLFPHGYLDLILGKLMKDNFGKGIKIIVLGDPLQAKYYNADDEDILEKGEQFPHDNGTPYGFYTYRNDAWIENLFGIPSLRKPISEIEDFDVLKSWNEADDLPLLVPSFRAKASFAAAYPERSNMVYTYGESQGLTFERALILLSRATADVSDGHAIVALTRGVRCPHFLLGEGWELNGILEILKPSSPIRRYLLGQKFDLEPRLNEEGYVLKRKPGLFGSVENEDRTEGDLMLRTYLQLADEVEIMNEEVIEVEVVEPVQDTCLPRADVNYEVLSISSVDPVRRASEYREAYHPGIGSSQQYRDTEHDHDNSNLSYSSADCFENNYPRHTTEDTLTFYMAVKKRLRFAQLETNSQNLDAAEGVAEKLWTRFTDVINLETSMDHQLLDQCVMDCENVRMLKSASLIENHSVRSDPDWQDDLAKIFMKSQICTKFDNRNIDAKAGQTLACFNHKILMHFGPWCRYAEAKLTKSLPERYYIHSRKNFNEFNAWVKNFMRPGVQCVESDYTAFDASQDANILAFELMFLKEIGWPTHLLEDYKHLKLTLGSKLGNFAIMRFTGEFGTFLFNTLANMAFTFTRYEIDSHTPICFAGDDMCALGPLQEDRKSDSLLDKLSLSAKVQRPLIPTFCGWCLTQFGIYKQPALVSDRCQIAREKGRIKECIDSYAIEVSYAYSLKDKLFEIMNEEQLLFHWCVLRFIINHKHLMKGESLALFDWKALTDEAKLEGCACDGSCSCGAIEESVDCWLPV